MFYCVQSSFTVELNSYEPTRHYFGATELNTAGRRAEILAHWTVFTKAAIEHRRMELARVPVSVRHGRIKPRIGETEFVYFRQFGEIN